MEDERLAVRLPRATTEPIRITWSPSPCASRSSHAIHMGPPSTTGTPACSVDGTSAHFSECGAFVANARATAS